MKYEAYRYLWPPRPDKAAPAELIGFYERRGWIAQVKKNGTCTVIFARGRDVIFKTRHNDDHKLWSPLPHHVETFTGRPDWNVYVAELLHSKGPQLKNHLYLFDILVSDGVQLTGTPLTERLEILRQRFPSPKADILGSRAGLGARMISEDISQAETVQTVLPGAERASDATTSARHGARRRRNFSRCCSRFEEPLPFPGRNAFA